MKKEKIAKNTKEHYERPEMKRVYSVEHKRHETFNAVAASGTCGGGELCGCACGE